MKGLYLIPLPWPALALLLLLCALQYIFARWSKELIRYRYRWIPGLNIQLFFFACGLMLGNGAEPSRDSQFFGNYLEADQKQAFSLVVEGSPLVREKSVKLFTRLKAMVHAQQTIEPRGKLLLYLERDSLSASLGHGDELLIHGWVKPVPGPRLPGEFSYANHLRTKGVYHQVYARATDWRLNKRGNPLSLTRAARRWQDALVQVIRERALDKEEEAVGCAMLLGFTEGFDPDLKGAYAKAGVTHILAVSGLHVGLVFLIFNKLLFFMGRNKQGKLLKSTLLVLLTWGYAFLTGLSPSVQRAAMMFSILIIGQSLQRKNDIVNTLSVAALVLAAIHPAHVFHYGFQLSFLAVLGIVKFQPMIRGAVYVRNRWLDKVWQLVAVTLAAQVVTGPLAMHYFHQFPTWFLPANLVVIPLSTGVMYLGIGLFAVSWWDTAATLVAWAFSACIRLMNACIHALEHLPFQTLEGLYPGETNTLLIYLSLIFIYLWVSELHARYSIALVGCLLCISLNSAWARYQQTVAKEWVFFQQQDQNWIGLRKGEILYLVSDSAHFQDTAEAKSAIMSYIDKGNIKQVIYHSSDQVQAMLPDARQARYWIIRKQADRRYLPLLSGSASPCLVLAPGIKYKEKNRWKSAAKAHQLKISDTGETGCITKRLGV